MFTVCTVAYISLYFNTKLKQFWYDVNSTVQTEQKYTINEKKIRREKMNYLHGYVWEPSWFKCLSTQIIGKNIKSKFVLGFKIRTNHLFRTGAKNKRKYKHILYEILKNTVRIRKQLKCNVQICFWGFYGDSAFDVQTNLFIFLNSS